MCFIEMKFVSPFLWELNYLPFIQYFVGYLYFYDDSKHSVQKFRENINRTYIFDIFKY